MMHIAILMTNTDESPFAQVRPKDGEKFQALLEPLRPEWRFDVFSVKDGIFPTSLDTFDGLIITGSPASVHDGDSWISQLLVLIRKAYAGNIPMFGACFGHQAIARALGADVVKNPGGWVFGRTETQITRAKDWMIPPVTSLNLYSAHKEQVENLPEIAEIVTRTPGCDIGGFSIGDTVFTTQYHPEMSPEFIADLVEELALDMGPDVTASARRSLSTKADTHVIAQWIVRFFEHAVMREEIRKD